jgi:hypothetical protein
VTSQTMLDEAVLEQLEAEFLRSPRGSWPLRSEIRPPAVEMPAPVVGWPVDDDPQGRITKIRTNFGCCR